MAFVVEGKELELKEMQRRPRGLAISPTDPFIGQNLQPDTWNLQPERLKGATHGV
jgi:hypothetical protein